MGAQGAHGHWWVTTKIFLTTGVKLTGQLSGWATPKDLILHLAGKLTVRGGTGRIIEYFGPGVEAQSCTGLATIANMGAEVGATTSTFPYSDNMRSYLHATARGPVADAADRAAAQGFLQADEGAEYDEVIEIVSFLQYHANARTSPNSSPTSTAPSHPILPLLFPSSLPSLRKTHTLQRCPLPSSDRAPTLHTKTCRV